MDMSTLDTGTTDVSPTATTGTGATGTSTTETTTEKLFGDPSADITDATYRFIAHGTRRLAYDIVKAQLPPVWEMAFGKDFHPVAEPVIGYLLAAVVELVPGKSLLPQRQRLAQNLRVETYQDAENGLFELGRKWAERRVEKREQMIGEALHERDKKIDEMFEYFKKMQHGQHHG
jgi:hypothetical protein